MDGVPDSTSINSPNINSVLKAPKQRVPLKDLMAAVPEEDNTVTRKRRVSFANVNKIKEFSAGAESMVVCQTPAYEEPFYASSDSSYPSGVDGWTPAKGQSSVYGQPLIYTEKENLSGHSTMMSLGMDLTTAVGNSVKNTRYSVNGMDLTEVANSHETFINQQTRLSYGMDLTNVVGNPYTNTRYSVSGMELTNMVPSNQFLVDQRSRFPMGMDLTNVVGNSTPNPRYSINGMDLTETVNPYQHFNDRKSSRISVGMEMTNVVGNPARYSCNEMDLTEAANPYCIKKQLSEEGSDLLDLTEAVDGVHFPTVSPKLKSNNVGLTGNVLYSVNNTRYSTGMDMTNAVGSHSSTARRKSSRYSLANMDLTEIVNNSCDDLEFTQVIGDPRIKAGSTRISVSEMDLDFTQAIGDPRVKAGSTQDSMNEMDLTESIGNGGVTRLSSANMDRTSVVSEQLEYSADTESIMNITKSSPDKKTDPLVCNNNDLTRQSPKLIGDPNIVSLENKTFVDPKMSNNSLCSDEHDINSEHLVIGRNEHISLLNDIPSNNSQIVNQDTNKIVYNTKKVPNGSNVDLPYVFNVTRESSQENAKAMYENEEFYAVENNSEVNQLPTVQHNVLEKKTSIVHVRSLSKTESSVKHLSDNVAINEKTFVLNASKLNMTEKGHINENSVNLNQNSSAKVSKSNKTEMYVDDLEHNLSSKAVPVDGAHSPCINDKVDVMLNGEAINKENTKQEIIGQQILNEDAMDVFAFDVSSSGKQTCYVKEPQAFEKENLETNLTRIENNPFRIGSLEIDSAKVENLETISKIPGEQCNLEESVMNMSIDNCSLIDEIDHDNRGENIDEKGVLSAEIGCGNQSNNSSRHIQKEIHQSINKHSTATNKSIESKVSPNTSLNLSSKSLLCKNVTMTRGRSYISTPEVSLEVTNGCDGTVQTKVSTEIPTMLPTSKLNGSGSGLCQSENDLILEISHLQSEKNLGKRGKRSFEEALEPENDTEESPIKLLRVSREEPSTELELLSNVMAPSFLMDTVAASPCSDHQATFSKLDPSCYTAPEGTCESKLEFSLRMDDSLARNMSETPLQNEVIDLCESSFDATSTDVRALMRNICDEDILTKSVKSLDSFIKETDAPDSKDQPDHSPQLCVLEDPFSNDVSNCFDTTGTDVLKKEVESQHTDHVPANQHLKSNSKRKKEKVRSLGNNAYQADFIPNFLEITFSIDSFGNTTNVMYHNICTGGDSVIGEYLLRQARNHELPEKGSDLILLLQSTNKSSLGRLARNINVICKYYNGSLKGDILTLGVASCKNHFLTYIDVNIKYPQFLNQKDISISKQEIGELKLSQVRRVASSVEQTEDYLLNLVEAIIELQY